MPLRDVGTAGGPFSAAVDDPTVEAASPSGPAPVSQLALALLDVLEGARAWHLWGLLGWQDIRRRYRRSRIGPFWLTISMGAMVGGIGFLFAGLFKSPVADFLPFLALGFIVWGLIAGLVNESCSAFIESESIIKQVKLPLSVYVYRVVWRNLIVFAHNCVIFIIVAAIFAVWPRWVGLLALPGLVLLCINGVWVGILFGLVCARFRDVPLIVANVMQLAFFMTPIIWMPEQLPERTWFLYLNPFYHLVELVRAPLLGHAPALTSWLAALTLALCGLGAALLMYHRYRRRIAYWL